MSYIIGAGLAGISAMLADLSFKPSDVSPATAVIGLELEHAGFLAGFMAMMDLDEEH